MELQMFCDIYLEKSQSSKKQYLCPFCNSGTGKKKTGAFTVYTDNYYCFSCGKHGSVLNLVEHIFKVPFSKASGKLKEILDNPNFKEYEYQYQSKKYEIEEINETDFEEFFTKAHENLYLGSDYLKKRGISDFVAKTFKLGFVEEWKINSRAMATPRLIIPNDTGYLARDTREEIPEKALGFTKMKVGKTSIFNKKILSDSNYNAIVITEGEIDVLSVYEFSSTIGAVGLCGVQNRKALIDLLKENPSLKDTTFILSLDNDIVGRQAQFDLSNLLEVWGFKTLEINLAGDYKDINEHLISDREGFSSLIAEIELNLG